MFNFNVHPHRNHSQMMMMTMMRIMMFTHKYTLFLSLLFLFSFHFISFFFVQHITTTCRRIVMYMWCFFGAVCSNDCSLRTRDSTLFFFVFYILFFYIFIFFFEFAPNALLFISYKICRMFHSKTMIRWQVGAILVVVL